MFMSRRYGIIGDPHGCLDEFIQLYKKLQWLSLDEIWCLGDLVDRGPDSGGLVQFLRENHIQSVRGNHDDSIVNHYKRFKKTGLYPKNEDKERTIRSLSDADYEYLDALPPLHVFDDIRLVLVHGGLWPRIPLYAQPKNVIRAQLIHTANEGQCRWWGKDATKHKCKKTEEESSREGYARWYHLYDYQYDCAYGHSVFNQPKVHQNPGYGRTVGLDQGSCFGGSLTAGIFDGGEPFFVSVRVLKCYAPGTRRVISDE